MTVKVGIRVEKNPKMAGMTKLGKRPANPFSREVNF